MDLLMPTLSGARGGEKGRSVPCQRANQTCGLAGRQRLGERGRTRQLTCNRRASWLLARRFFVFP